jgi:hypothetical protein
MLREIAVLTPPTLKYTSVKPEEEPQPKETEFPYTAKKLRAEYIKWLPNFPFAWFITLTFRFPKFTKKSAIDTLRRFVHRFERAVYGKNRAGRTIHQRLSMIVFIEPHYFDGFHFHCLVQAPTDTGKLNGVLYTSLFRKIWEEVGGGFNQFRCDVVASPADVIDYSTKKIFRDKNLVIVDWFQKRAD